MNYSAGMVSQVFAFVETKQTAELMAAGMSKDEIKDKVIGENLYQLRNETRLRRTFNYVYNRLSSLPDGAVELLVKVDNENAKLLTLIAIMNTDKLFFEFVYDVYRGKVILGEKTIEDRDINGFFDDKTAQSEEVAGWSESGIKKLKNCYMKNLADANYYGRRGILVVKKGKELSISNPGTIRVTKEEFYAGGNSDPRNPNILKMFGFVNVGERAGSGVDKIMTAWAEQNWKKPEFDFSERSDRVTLKLEVGQVVYIPGAADIRNENTNQEKATAVSKEDKILEYIRQNGSISSQKAADIGGYKSKTGARKLLDKMIEKGLITKSGNGPATKYM